jgi:hypothetical protein
MCRACVVAFAVAVASALSAVPGTAGAQKWYEKAVKKLDAKFTPAEAKPGETVTFALTIELNDGYYTYPTAQTDPAAAGMVNVFKAPKPGAVVFVGAVSEGKVQTKAEPELGIKELRYLPGTATYTHKVVVSPTAAPGATTVKLTEFALSVCDKSNCFPPKKVPVEAVLKVLDAPAVPVERAFADEVKKALGE